MTPRVRCSNLPQLFACPGSRTLVERLRELGATFAESSPEATEGNWVHWKARNRLITEQDAVAPDGVALTEPDYKPSPFAHWMADFCYEKAIEGLTLDWAITVEQEMEHEFPGFVLTGHPDVVALRFENVEGEVEQQVVEAIVTDWKAGANPVDPADVNEQIMGYVVLLFLRYPYLRKVTARIVQPRNREDEGVYRVSEFVVEGLAKLGAAVAYLVEAVTNALSRGMELSSDGGKQCRWCPAALQCPCLKAEIDLMKLTLTPEHLAAITAEPTIVRLVEIEDARKVLSPLMEKANDTLKARLKDNPQTLPDGRVAKVLTQPYGIKFTDVPTAYKLIEELPDESFFGCIKLVKDGIIDGLAATAGVPKSGKAEVTGEKLFKEKFAHCTERGTRETLLIA